MVPIYNRVSGDAVNTTNMVLQPNACLKAILVAAANICRQDSALMSTTFSRRFRALFGASPTVCQLIWFRIRPSLPETAEIKFLLCGLVFLKVYSTEHVHAAMLKMDEKNVP